MGKKPARRGGLRCGQDPPARRAVAEARTVLQGSAPVRALETDGVHADMNAEQSAKSLVTITQSPSLRQQKGSNRRSVRKNGKRPPLPATEEALPWCTVPIPAQNRSCLLFFVEYNRRQFEGCFRTASDEEPGTSPLLPHLYPKERRRPGALSLSGKASAAPTAAGTRSRPTR
jgi:hypothetical protein